MILLGYTELERMFWERDDYLEKLRKVLKEIIINSDVDEQAKRILQEIMEGKVA